MFVKALASLRFVDISIVAAWGGFVLFSQMLIAQVPGVICLLLHHPQVLLYTLPVLLLTCSSVLAG